MRSETQSRAKAHPNKKAAAYARTRHRRGEHSRRREGVLPQAIAVACAVWLCHRRNPKPRRIEFHPE